MERKHQKQTGWRSERAHRDGRYGRRHIARGRVSGNQLLAARQEEDEKYQFLKKLFELIEEARDAGIPHEEAERAVLEGMRRSLDRWDVPPNKARVAQEEEAIRLAIRLSYGLGDFRYRN
jgi:hypothetical protein